MKMLYVCVCVCLCAYLLWLISKPVNELITSDGICAAVSRRDPRQKNASL